MRLPPRKGMMPKLFHKETLSHNYSFTQQHICLKTCWSYSCLNTLENVVNTAKAVVLHVAVSKAAASKVAVWYQPHSNAASSLISITLQCSTHLTKSKCIQHIIYQEISTQSSSRRKEITDTQRNLQNISTHNSQHTLYHAVFNTVDVWYQGTDTTQSMISSHENAVELRRLTWLEQHLLNWAMQAQQMGHMITLSL